MTGRFYSVHHGYATMTAGLVSNYLLRWFDWHSARPVSSRIIYIYIYIIYNIFQKPMEQVGRKPQEL